MYDHARRRHWPASTFVVGPGIIGLTARVLFDGPMDGDCLLAYPDQILVPTLQAGGIVVIDNLASHHAEGVPERIEATGALLWHSHPAAPNLNPIELQFVELKAPLRAARGRVVEERRKAMPACPSLFSPAVESRDCFCDCGSAAASQS